MGVIKAVVGDAVLTFVWVFVASTLGAVTSVITTAFGVEGSAPETLLVTAALLYVIVTTFTVIGDAIGGASFNPTANAAFYAAGVGDDNLVSLGLRFPAQALGATMGALAITEVMPMQYKGMLEGPSLKVDLHTGAIAEAILTFAITIAVLFIVLKGPKSAMVKTFLITLATVAVLAAGSQYTGPSMNPANAYGWAYLNNEHHTWDQFYVYWVCPFVGAILAAWVFRFFFPPAPAPAKPSSKKKKRA